MAPGRRRPKPEISTSPATAARRRRSSRPPAPPESSSTKPTADGMPEVGVNLRWLRAERGLSLEKLAHAAGVSRAMLGQIELGHSTPTIKTL